MKKNQDQQWDQRQRTTKPVEIHTEFALVLKYSILGGVTQTAHTTIILNESEIWELSPHVADDTMQATGRRRELLSQRLLENSLLEQERWGWVRGVNGDSRSLHRRHNENKPAEK